MNNWKLYLRFYKGQYFKFFQSILLSILQSAIIIPIALLVRSLFDRALPEKNFSQLVLFSAAISALYILNGVVTIWTRHITLKTTKRVIRIIRNTIINKFYLLPKEYFAEIDRVKLHAAIVQDSFRLDVMSNGLIAQLLPAAFISLGLTFLLVYLDISLFLIVSMISPLLFVFGKFLGRVLRGKINSYHRYFEMFSKRVLVLLDIIDLTRVSVSEKNEMEKQASLHKKIEKKSFEQAWFGAVYKIFHETAMSAFGVVIIIAGGYRVIKGIISIGDLFAFFTALGLLKKNIVIISSVVPKIIEGMESLRSIFGFLNEKRDVPYLENNGLKFNGKIDLDRVNFSYGKRKLLENISFSINPGEVVLLTGPNGSGKSTIINLILGFYRPDSGTISADGIDYKMLNMMDIRRSTGVVFQDMMLFPGTIRENILYGVGECPEDDLLKVLELSGSNEFINRLPDGLNTFVENMGAKLSGGELQKIAIARSLLGNNRLIIMDEPTTNLDKRSLKKIIGNLKEYFKDSSLFIISHEDELLDLADRKLEICERTLYESEKPDIS